MNKHWDQTTDEAEPQVPVSAPVETSASAAPSTSDKSTADSLHFLELVNLLRRRKRLILTIALCGAMLVFTVGLLKPPKYTAAAQIAVDLPSSSAQGAAARACWQFG